MDLHVIVPGCAPDLVARVVNGRLIIVPPAPPEQPACASAPAQPAPGR